MKRPQLSVFVSIVATSTVLGLFAAGCEKKPEATATSAASAASSASPMASAAPAASSAAPVDPDLGKGPPPAVQGGFKGPFTAKVGVVTLQKDVKDTTDAWGKDPGKEAIGPGSLELTITNTRVSGTGAGSLGDLTLEGVIDGKEVRTVLNPKDPRAPHAMTGIFTGVVKDGKIVGKIRTSSKNGNVVREAEVTLSP